MNLLQKEFKNFENGDFVEAVLVDVIGRSGNKFSEIKVKEEKKRVLEETIEKITLDYIFMEGQCWINEVFDSITLMLHLPCPVNIKTFPSSTEEALSDFKKFLQEEFDLIVSNVNFSYISDASDQFVQFEVEVFYPGQFWKMFGLNSNFKKIG